MDKILIWGTGQIEHRINKEDIRGEVIGYIETTKSKEYYNGKKVYEIDNIPKNFEYIVVANTYTNDIYDLCLKKNIKMDRVIFMAPVNRKVGIDDKKLIKSILGDSNYDYYSALFNDYDETFFNSDITIYNELNQRSNFKIDNGNLWPVVMDKYSDAGVFTNYLWQDLWAAKHIYNIRPKVHFDIGSRVDGFITHLLSMDVPVTLIDIRDFPLRIEGLNTIIDDATTLSQIEDNSLESMSALCSLEHFGLGRYGDPIDPEACFKCFYNIQKKLKKDANLYISVPIGRERVEFNAHRIFYPSTVIDSFSSLRLIEFSCATKDGIEVEVDINKYNNDNHNGDYRYGLFHFQK